MSNITFEHITKRYSDGFEAVKDMNLTIDDGELMVLVGPSGSGKSTALRMVAGLEDITDGELKIGDEVVNQRAPKDRDVAMVFQNYALYPHMTVRENMGFALRLAKTPRQEIDRRIHTAAKILDIEEHLDRKPANLSGGQRQRVAMGRAIVRDPKAFLMDEPLSNLDARLRAQVRTEIGHIQRQLGTTTIYVTHDQVEAMTLGDRLAVMDHGMLQQVGTPLELYARPINVFVGGFIGSPSMNFLPGHLDGCELHMPLGRVRIADGLLRRLNSAPDRDHGQVIVGIRPEAFEDATLATEPSQGHTLRAKVNTLEALGSEDFVHFLVDSGPVASSQLQALAHDHRADGMGKSRQRVEVVARISNASRLTQGRDAELWFDTSQLHFFDSESGRNLLVDRA
jgi:multiple sugar transport system ATP-binding protein